MLFQEQTDKKNHKGPQFSINISTHYLGKKQNKTTHCVFPIQVMITKQVTRWVKSCWMTALRGP